MSSYQAFRCIILAATLSCSFAQHKRGPYSVGRWGKKGGGHGKPKGPPPAPPKESKTACQGLSEKAVCTFLDPRRGTTLCGKCIKSKRHDYTHCRPKGGKRKRASDCAAQENLPPPKPGVDKVGGRGKYSAVGACKDKEAEEECSFFMGVRGDQEARGRHKGKKRGRGPPKRRRRMKTGICVPMNKTVNGKDVPSGSSFCRPLPPPEATAACVDATENDACSFKRNGSEVRITLKAWTSLQDLAETSGDVLASFLINNTWTEGEPFIEGGVARGAMTAKLFKLADWPSQVTLTAWSNDAWNFWKILINNKVVIEDPKGKAGSEPYATDSTFANSDYWVEGPPASQIFDVPELASVDVTAVTVKVFTSTNASAATTGTVSVSFLVNEVWTVAEQMFSGANAGEEKSKMFNVASWPEKIWVGTDSSDAYAFTKITVNAWDVIDDVANSGGSQEFDEIADVEDAPFWISAPPSSQTFDVPARDGGRPKWRANAHYQINGTCQEAWWDSLSGNLHCRPDGKKWRPGAGKKNHGGDRYQPNTMEPDFRVKSDAPAPIPITVQMTIKNMDYAKLMQDVDAQNSLKGKVKTRVAASAGQGVYEKHIEVDLSPGSVVVLATVNPPAYVSRTHVSDQLKADSTLTTNVLQDVKSDPKLVALSSGAITIAAPIITITVVSAPAPAPAKDDDSNIKVILIAVGAGAIVVAIALMAIVFCLCMRLRAKNANPVNGTTVAVGRPVTAEVVEDNVTSGTAVLPAEKEQGDKEMSKETV